jgi:hypothetical protein
MNIMKPGHPRWSEFIGRLKGPEGCNFIAHELGNPASITYRCLGGKDKSKAIAIMKEMGGLNIRGSLLYFEKHGGFCDCEILFNVEVSAHEMKRGTSPKRMPPSDRR